MKERFEWVRDNPKSIVSGLTGVVVVVFFALVVYNTTAAWTSSKVVEKNAQQIKGVVKQLVKADAEREKRVSKLIDNNNRQTLILCKLILNQGAELSAEEKAQVEAACNDRIEAEEVMQPSSSAGTGGSTGENSGNSGFVNQSSSNPTPPARSSQPDTSQPPAEETPPTPTDDRSTLQRLPAVGGFFEAIGL